MKTKTDKKIETAEVPEKKKRIRTPAKKEHYVNNKEFLAAMVEYKEKCKKAEARGRKNPPVTNYIGECFLKIANHLSYRPNFINYTFRDDMISGNFNPDKSNNPFAYFTQIIYYAFVRRIQKEKKQTTIKHKLIMDANYDDMTLQPGEDRDFKNQFTEFLQKNLPNQEPTSDPYEAKPKGAKLKRTRKAKINLENF